VFRSRRQYGQGIYHAWERLDVLATIYSQNVKRREYLEDMYINARIILKWILKKPVLRTWIL
jgi:hypothetical protein